MTQGNAGASSSQPTTTPDPSPNDSGKEPGGARKPPAALVHQLANPKSALWSTVWQLCTLALVVFGLILAWRLLHAVTVNLGDTDIANPEFMRGLITILLLGGTLVLTAILVLAAVMRDSGKVDDDTKRLTSGREVITPLVGILGTIVGFYFGLNATPTGTKGKTVTGDVPTTQQSISER